MEGLYYSHFRAYSHKGSLNKSPYNMINLLFMITILKHKTRKHSTREWNTDIWPCQYTLDALLIQCKYGKEKSVSFWTVSTGMALLFSRVRPLPPPRSIWTKANVKIGVSVVKCLERPSSPHTHSHIYPGEGRVGSGHREMRIVVSKVCSQAWTVALHKLTRCNRFHSGPPPSGRVPEAL